MLTVTMGRRLEVFKNGEALSKNFKEGLPGILINLVKNTI